MPDGLSTEYWFVDKEVGGDGTEYPSIKKTLPNLDESWHGIETEVTELQPCTLYETVLVAKNADGEKRAGNIATFETECHPPKVETSEASQPKGLEARTKATLNGWVYPYGLETKYWFEYGKARDIGEHREPVEGASAGSGESWVSKSEPVSGLTSCTGYEYRIVAENEDSKRPGSKDEGGVVRGAPETFTTACYPPQAKTTGFADRKSTSVLVEGEVEPDELPTMYWFEYALKGSSEWTSTSALEAGSGKGFVAEHTTLHGLAICTEYQFRMTAANEDAYNGPSKGPVYGTEKYFKTICPPAIQGVKVSHLEHGSVVLEGEVNPEEAETHYRFEYDTRAYRQGEGSHGTSVPLPEPSLGSGVVFVKTSIAVVGLTAGQTYYFNVRATNESGVTTGEGSLKTPVEWELGGKDLVSPVSVGVEGAVKILGSECLVRGEGIAGVEGGGEIVGVTGLLGERAARCERVAGECESVVEAVHLPWRTGLVSEPVRDGSGEIVRWVSREVVDGGSGGAPGWAWYCAGEPRDKITCVGEVEGVGEDLGSGVGVEFPPVSASCELEGVRFDESLESVWVLSDLGDGGVLSVSGAVRGPLPPVVGTGAVSGVSGVSATLTGTVAAKGAATKYWFEYGPTTGYGSRIPVGEGSAGEGRLRVGVSQKVSGLTPGVLYHYRLIASNGGGMSYGEDRTFTPGHPSEWLLNGAQFAAESFKVEGPVVVLGDECSMAGSGSLEGVPFGGEGSTITKVTGPHGESGLSCAKPLCGSGATELTAAHLPWKIELVNEPVENTKGEVERWVSRVRVFGGTGGRAEWLLRCASEGATVVCASEASGVAENATGGVPVEFAGVPASCEFNGDGLNFEFDERLESALTFKGAGEGSVLSISSALAAPLSPMVATGGVREVTGTSVKLAGWVSAKGVSTDYWFEYGKSTGYGSKIPVSSGEAGSGRLRVEESQKVSGLAPDTLYHYRLAASNSGGTSYGEDKTFTPGHPSEWLLSGQQFATEPLKVEGSIVIFGDECSMIGSGSVEGVPFGGEGSAIAKVTGPHGESGLSCKKPLCGSGTTELEPEHLPWKTELIDEPVKNAKGEIERWISEVRIYGGSAGKPEWLLKCSNESWVMTCAGEATGIAENITAGVPVEFAKRSTTCELTSGGTHFETDESLESALTFKSGTEGKVLSVSGAPPGPLPPVVITGGAREVTNSGAKLTGTIAAKGAATTYRFEYGKTKSYGAAMPLPEGGAGEGRLSAEVTQAITGLESGTLYHYRLVATNSAGTSYGEDRTVTPGYPSYWEVNGELAAPHVTGTGVLKINGIECDIHESGSVVLGEGEVTSVSCPGVEQCGGSPALEPVHLPWRTELMDVPIKNAAGEVERYEVRQRLYGAKGSEPGWNIVCAHETVLSCLGEVSGKIENLSSGVATEFDPDSPEMSCGGGHGAIIGSISFTTGETGKVLSASGAPKGPLPPGVSTGEAKTVSRSSATLTGTITPKGVPTTYQFEYSTTKGYGSRIPVTPGSAGEGRLPTEVAQTITGLEPRTLYHYRLVATNTAGTTYGEDRTLGTETPAAWQINGEDTAAAPVKAEGTLTVHDNGLETSAECQIQQTGEVGVLHGEFLNQGEARKITGPKGENTITCHTLQAGWCGTSPIEIEAQYLPWNTEIVEQPIENNKSETHYEPRLRYYAHETTTTPALTVKCNFMGSVANDACTGEPSGKIENTASGVAVDFESKSLTLACAGSALGTGTIEGKLTFKSTETGKTLSVYGAPGP